jgi:hypothetical protein
MKTHMGFDPPWWFFCWPSRLIKNFKARGEGDYRISSLLLPNAEVSAEWPGLVVIIVIIGVIVIIVLPSGTSRRWWGGALNEPC